MSMLRPYSITPQNGQKVAVSFTLMLVLSYKNSKPTCSCRYKIISKAHTGRIRILIVFIDLEFTF